jgi:hypothetical protein
MTAYCTHEEYDSIKKLAEEGGLSVSEHLKQAGLQTIRPIAVSTINRKAYLEIGQLRMHLSKIRYTLDRLTRTYQQGTQTELSTHELKQYVGKLDEWHEQMRQVQLSLILSMKENPIVEDDADVVEDVGVV